jgi:lysophospholipase L1-like esterase
MYFSSRIALCVLLSCIAVSALVDLGAPGYTCPAETMAPSQTVPTSAHKVRPADIKIIAALGDSLTAGNGAGATNPLGVLLQYRGLTFAVGGDSNLDTHVTVANVLKKYNPSLFGYSRGIGDVNVWNVAQLNAGVPGAQSSDLPAQARDLVHKMQIHPEINMQEDWKLINIFIGGNDICAYCHDNGNAQHSPQHFADNIVNAIRILQDNLPRTIVSLTMMLHLEILRAVDSGHAFCQGLHVFECNCEGNAQFTNDDIKAVCIGYQQAQQAIQDSGMFDIVSRDDFTLVIQPFFKDNVMPPKKPDGSVDEAFFAPDCFHFSQYGHAIVAKGLWNNLLEPVGAKTTAYNLTDYTVPLNCPQANCPYIRTTKNSMSC